MAEVGAAKMDSRAHAHRFCGRLYIRNNAEKGTHRFYGRCHFLTDLCSLEHIYLTGLFIGHLVVAMAETRSDADFGIGCIHRRLFELDAAAFEYVAIEIGVVRQLDLPFVGAEQPVIMPEALKRVSEIDLDAFPSLDRFLPLGI